MKWYDRRDNNMDDKGESKIKNNSAYRYLLESSGSAENRRRDENG